MPADNSRSHILYPSCVTVSQIKAPKIHQDEGRGQILGQRGSSAAAAVPGSAPVLRALQGRGGNCADDVAGSA